MSNDNSSGGLSLGAVLTIIFVVLKLTHHIDWAWYWVVSPIIISFVFWFCIFFLDAVSKSPWER